MLQLFNTNRQVLTKTIVSVTALLAASFTAGAQEHELDVNLAERKEEIASCFYNWDCFGPLDMYEENLLVQLIGFKCPEAEAGWGSVSPGGRKGTEQ